MAKHKLISFQKKFDQLDRDIGAFGARLLGFEDDSK
jgi:hypothetical protein